jgi:hypothetical protein
MERLLNDIATTKTPVHHAADGSSQPPQIPPY